jgi:hypothetical protein
MPDRVIENEFVRVRVEETPDLTIERIELNDGTNWVPLLSSLPMFGTLLFVKNKFYYSKLLSYKSGTPTSLIFQLDEPDASITLEINLTSRDMLHYKYEIQSKAKFSLSKLIAGYKVSLGTDPDFKWVPHLRPKEHYVMGDHIFRSPVIIFSKNAYSFAFIPDLALLGNNRPFQTLMDLNLKSEGTEGSPQLVFGFGNYRPIGHVFFKHNPKKLMKIKKGTNLPFGYYIKIFKDTPANQILEQVNGFLWATYGRPLLKANLNPQVLPYDKNVEEGFKAILERHKYWVDFPLNNQACGGVFQNTWLGKRKRKLKFTAPEDAAKRRTENISQIAGQETFIGKIIMHLANSAWWIRRFDWFTRTFPIIKRTAEIWNNAWFLNIRTGYGFRAFGELWQDAELSRKGTIILNTVLNLPRTHGAFPSVILPASWDATTVSTINGLKAFVFTDDFHLVDTALTMYWALKFYQDFEPREEIKHRSAELLELLEEIQLPNGAIPTYINFEADKKTPIVKDTLINSASTGAPLMFLTEYYKVSKEPRIIPIAEKIVKYLQTEIIPQNKWHDFEPFFSCTHFPLDFYDAYTKSHVMNALCIYWSAEGLKELYKITNKREYLEAGAHVLSILSLFQQVWNQPYMHFNTFGGFCSQNADAELSDARQGLFIRTYMEYYLLTGKHEYMERAIATLRASWAMQLLREYEDQCPGNLKGISTLDGIDRGCVCENYGHSGHDLRIPGYIMFDWGVGTCISATAYAKKHFGDLFLDFKEQAAWGLDGILVRASEFATKIIHLTIEKLPTKNTFIIKARDVPSPEIELIINTNSLGRVPKAALESGFVAHL